MTKETRSIESLQSKSKKSFWTVKTIIILIVTFLAVAGLAAFVITEMVSKEKANQIISATSAVPQAAEAGKAPDTGSNLQTKSTTGQSQSDNSVTETTQPVTRQTQPVPGTTQPTQPVTGATQSVTGTTQQGTGAASTTSSDQPVAGATQQGTGAASTTSSDQPVTGTTQQGTGAASTTSIEPNGGTQPVTEIGPGAGGTEPGTGTTQPGDEATEPVKSTDNTDPGTTQTQTEVPDPNATKLFVDERIYFPRNLRVSKNGLSELMAQIWSVNPDGTDLRCHLNGKGFEWILSVKKMKNQPKLIFADRDNLKILDMSNPDNIKVEPFRFGTYENKDITCLRYDISANDEILAFDNIREWKLQFIDMKTKSVLASYPLSIRFKKFAQTISPDTIRSSPDGKRIYFIRSYSNAPKFSLIEMLTIEGEHVVIADLAPENTTNFLLAPDEQTIFYINNDQQLTSLDINVKDPSPKVLYDLRTLGDNVKLTLFELSTDGSTIYLIHQSKPGLPENFYKFNLENTEMTPFLAEGETFDFDQQKITGQGLSTQTASATTPESSSTSTADNSGQDSTTQTSEETVPGKEQSLQDKSTTDEAVATSLVDRILFTKTVLTQNDQGTPTEATEILSVNAAGDDLRTHMFIPEKCEGFRQMKNRPIGFFKADNVLKMVDLTVPDKPTVQPFELSDGSQISLAPFNVFVKKIPSIFDLSSNDKTLVLFTAATRTLKFIDIDSKSVTAEINFEKVLEPEGNPTLIAMRCSPDGKSIYYSCFHGGFTNSRSRVIGKLDDGGNYKVLVKVTDDIRNFLVSPNEQTIYYIDNNYKLKALNITDDNPGPIIVDGFNTDEKPYLVLHDISKDANSIYTIEKVDQGKIYKFDIPKLEKNDETEESRSDQI